ncbi:MAG: polyamine ABC transporter ATP-binding protein [Alphaproteobacteria bacterium]|jgi:putrescine transport system ATP-binding protein|uniref:ABC transporter ATP-binding protein n=1 Tax=Devosia sp. XGJD_8 TaxID=3391187 RepID=UPI001D944EA5|nr:polyamine ABC transporter ATP-binding protein [Alphaproteobacteria bacterium]MBU1561570.1 polyamine ABC transporter ATP-binding protein [Alphaproteobacteria bacterium]MBU2303059.1 polyamine ABC transporter ATP-binding protein [Alphaproteobacteria bacterium]MBU2366474.1 polyamine ABC transporter ATP-binding protein [Alphaproteobacteria bacterium]
MAKKPQLAIDTRPWRDPAAKPFVRIRNVTKKFGDVHAVHDVSLDIYKSELFCLLGGSGSGKSTLLRMLAGFEEPTAGTIEIDGQDMTHVAPYNRPVNMMFQSYALFPHMNVEQNIAYGLKRDHLPKGEIADRVAELLSLVKLSDYGKRKPHQLSGGQRQRVALARALAKRPKLLLLDEPLGALDKKLREETQFELVKIQETLGVTFIVVTHDQEEAMSLATRIGVMNQGEIAMIGEPTDIYEFPNSRFVAGFIGSVNMAEGVVIEDEPDHVRIRSAELGCDIYVDHGVDCAPDQILWWAVRPEKIHLSREAPDNPHDANVTRGLVEEISYLGDMSVYQVLLDSGKRLRVTQTNTVRGNPDSITWDEPVYCTWGGNAGSVLTV